jgi:hypothetical protein
MNKSELDQLDVRPVLKEVAREMIVTNHYSKKWQSTFGLKTYGVYRNNVLLGVAAYGHPMNPGSWDSVTTVNQNECIELNRLWIDDVLGANVETWFMAKTFRLLKNDGYRLIQSFADGRLGVGTIYQAANFSYHGSHETLFHQTSDGLTWHDTPFNNTANPRVMLFRNMFFVTDTIKTFKIKTYRYLYALDRAAKKSVKLQFLPYPKKRVGPVLIENYKPPANQIARSVAIADAIGDYEKKSSLRLFLDNLTDDADSLILDASKNKWIKPLYNQKNYMLDFESLIEG